MNLRYIVRDGKYTLQHKCEDGPRGPDWYDVPCVAVPEPFKHTDILFNGVPSQDIYEILRLILMHTGSHGLAGIKALIDHMDFQMKELITLRNRTSITRERLSSALIAAQKKLYGYSNTVALRAQFSQETDAICKELGL